eukprot:1800509-Rhodomonas_salina.3
MPPTACAPCTVACVRGNEREREGCRKDRVQRKREGQWEGRGGGMRRSQARSEEAPGGGRRTPGSVRGSSQRSCPRQ